MLLSGKRAHAIRHKGSLQQWHIAQPSGSKR